MRKPGMTAAANPAKPAGAGVPAKLAGTDLPPNAAAPVEDDELLDVGADDAAEPTELGPIDVTIEAGAEPERLDAALARRIPALSRSRLKALIAEGRVSGAAGTLSDGSRRVNAGERFVVDVPAAVAAIPQPEAIPLDVVYEDAELLVVDKPAGLVVHPGAGNFTGTLVNALLHHCGASLSGIGGVSRPGIVHRLDKDTTGLMVVAKTDRAHLGLSKQFADHGREGPLERAYLAIVWGVPRQSAGTLESQIGRSPKNREQMAVVNSGGREAITHYEIVERFALPAETRRQDQRRDTASSEAEVIASLVECRLETGRTHQIRVHMAAMGHPLLGDADYGSGYRTKVDKLQKSAPDVAAALLALDRQALHAYLLAFEHPKTRKVMRFEGDLPTDFSRLLEALRAVSAQKA
ncbi:MAG: pseudouridine synthase [Ancalomicrobiaceae bacterium]|nr:pseudouridine synthase [Ancalomicrobiaceae bacterium]